jgi:para-nitrobenzyl esterase
MLDIIAALHWVHDNIAAVGGDPGNVTIFGQSGGGSKVSVLMAMPAAKGLFHKAIIQSGSLIHALSRAEATRTTNQVLEQLGLAPSQVHDLQRVPAERLLQSLELVRTSARLGVIDTERRFFNPVVDGRSLPEQPWDPAAPVISAEVPLLVGTTANEGTLLAMVNPGLFDLDRTNMRTQLNMLGFTDPEIEQVLRAYSRTRPNASPSELFFAIAGDRYFRKQAIKNAELKVEQGKAPTYMYLFAWNAPAFGGKYRSFHGVEQPFVFDNLDLAPGVWESKRDPRCDDLAEKVSKAWAAFARGGSPNHSKLPKWDPYTLARRQTMVFDFTCEQRDDPGREDRLAMREVSTPNL